MKAVKLIIIFILIGAVAFGWGSVILSNGSELVKYNSNIKTADKLVKEGLYQRAALKYQDALDYKENLKIQNKKIDAYEKRYKESDTVKSDYVDALKAAIEKYPDNVNFNKKLVDIYIGMSSFEDAYDVLVTAIDNGLEDKELLKLKTELQYSGTLSSSAYNEISSLNGKCYTVRVDKEYGAVDTSGEKIIKIESPFMGHVNGDGVFARRAELRDEIADSKDMVYGIFDNRLEAAYLMVDNIMPVKVGKKWFYVDDFAKKKFGDYTVASSFQDKKAAVCNGMKVWWFIDDTGKKISEDFGDVVLNRSGLYKFDDRFSAADKSGKYHFYDDSLKQIGDFSCDGLDIPSEDGLTAFKKGNKWGFVDSKGKVVIEPQYEGARSFANGLAGVCVDGKWGFINKDNKIVIKCSYVDTDYFNADGSCMVKCSDDGKLKSQEEETSKQAEDKAEVKETEDQKDVVTCWRLYILNIGKKKLF